MDNALEQVSKAQVGLPPEIGDVIAIANKINVDSKNDNFITVFEAAIAIYYRIKFSEPYSVPLRSRE